MKVFQLANSVDDVLKTLSTPDGVKKFKLNKLSVVKLPKLSDRIIKDVDYKDTTFACIQVTKDLYVIDCDNLHSFNFIYNLTITHNCPTLTTKSPFGGHFFFKRNDEPLIKSFIVGGEAAKRAAKESYGDYPLAYYSSSKLLDIEFFGYENKGNGVIFDGYNNGYYKHYGDVFDINPMSSEFFAAIQELSESYRESSFTSRAKTNIESDGKVFNPNKSRARKIKEWLKLQEIPAIEFLACYDPRGDKKLDLYNIHNRNQTLNTIAFWGGISGYLTKEEWTSFVWLMYNQYFKDAPGNGPFTEEEVKKTILADGKFERLFRESKETKKLEKQKKIDRLTYAQQLVTSNKPFFALNPEQSGANAILYIEKTDTQVRITARNESSAKTKALSDPFLREEYITKVKDEDGKTVEIFNKKKLCYLNLIHSPNVKVDKPYSIYTSGESSHINLNLSWYDQNPNIKKFTNQTKDEIRRKFESTFCYKVISENLLMSKTIRAKFFGDLGVYIQHPKMLNSMLVVRGEGGTGKDKILANFISVAIYGISTLELPKIDELSDSLVKARKQRGRAVVATPSLLVGSEFNDLLRNKLVIFSENAKDFKYKPSSFLEVLKPYISGSETIVIHPKGKVPEIAFNDKYFVWFTNYEREILAEKSDNRRYYFSYSKRNIDIRLKDERIKIYKELNYDLNKIDFTTEQTEIISVFKMDEQTILDYLTFVAPYEDDYCGYSILPEDALEADTFDDEGLEFEDMSEDSNPLEAAKTALRTFISADGRLKTSNCIDHYENDSSSLKDVARVFLAIASYQLTGYDRFKGLREINGRTYSVSDISKIFMSIRTFKSLRDQSVVKKYFDHELKKVTNVTKKGCVPNTRSKIKLKGEI